MNLSAEQVRERIMKSSRHSKITGDFGEHLVLYWLSLHGFECAKVDHTGMDIIARSPVSTQVMGISVKSRSRLSSETAASHINLPAGDIDKLLEACGAFGCDPFIAFVVDARAQEEITGYIVPLKKFTEYGRSWKMSQTWVNRYKEDAGIRTFHLATTTKNWW